MLTFESSAISGSDPLRTLAELTSRDLRELSRDLEALRYVTAEGEGASYIGWILGYDR